MNVKQVMIFMNFNKKISGSTSVLSFFPPQFSSPGPQQRRANGCVVVRKEEMFTGSEQTNKQTKTVPKNEKDAGKSA